MTEGRGANERSGGADRAHSVVKGCARSRAACFSPRGAAQAEACGSGTVAQPEACGSAGGWVTHLFRGGGLESSLELASPTAEAKGRATRFLGD